MRFVALVIFAMLSLSSQPSIAAQFRCHLFVIPNEIASCDFMSELVTDSFVAKYPAAKFEIVVLAGRSYFPNNNLSMAYATAGVVPLAAKGMSYVPEKRYGNAVTDTRNLTSAQQQEMLRDAIRGAVSELVVEATKR